MSLSRFPYSHELNDGYNFRWDFDAPWHVFSLRSWFFKRWLDLGQRRGDNAYVSHRGFRVFGIRRDEWVVHK